jgi:hypothetical protein
MGKFSPRVDFAPVRRPRSQRAPACSGDREHSPAARRPTPTTPCAWSTHDDDDRHGLDEQSDDVEHLEHHGGTGLALG